MFTALLARAMLLHHSLIMTSTLLIKHIRIPTVKLNHKDRRDHHLAVKMISGNNLQTLVRSKLWTAKEMKKAHDFAVG